jgi:hypothetical protein
MCCDSNSRLILAGVYCASCWRTDGSGSVEICEPHSIGRQLVDVWRINEIIAIAADVLPPHIVNENQNDVGTVGSPELRFAESHQQHGCDCCE